MKLQKINEQTGFGARVKIITIPSKPITDRQELVKKAEELLTPAEKQKIIDAAKKIGTDEDLITIKIGDAINDWGDGYLPDIYGHDQKYPMVVNTEISGKHLSENLNEKIFIEKFNHDLPSELTINKYDDKGNMQWVQITDKEQIKTIKSVRSVREPLGKILEYFNVLKIRMTNGNYNLMSRIQSYNSKIKKLKDQMVK